MVKIAHLITGLNIGGAETMLLKLLRETNRQVFDSSVISLMDIGPIGVKIQDLGVPVYALGLARGHVSFKDIKILVQLLRREQPTILQTWLYHANLLGQVGGWMAKVPHIIWNVRSANYDLYSYPWSTIVIVKLGQMLSRYPSTVIINSIASQKLHMAWGYRPRHWTCIPNGFDLNRFAPNATTRAAVRGELGIREDAIVIGHVGRYHPMKDHGTFLQAAQLLANNHPETHFVLSGRDVIGTNPDFVRWAHRQSVNQHIHFLGERSDVPQLMAAMDIFCSSSISESFPNVVGEAMASQLPCVVTDVGDSALLIGDTGIVVPTKAPEVVAAAWAQLINAGRAMRMRMGCAARARIEQYYSIEQVVDDYETLYLNLGTK